MANYYDGKQFVLNDNHPEHSGHVIVDVNRSGGFLEILPHGYGENAAVDGEGAPIVIELYEGRLRLIISRDINVDDHEIIDMEGARESLRTKGT